MRRTEIGYADYSCNPIRARRTDAPRTVEEAERFEGRMASGWACVRVSEGCKNCYAATLNKRLGTGLDYSFWNMGRVETYLDEKVIQDMLRFRPKPTFRHDTLIPLAGAGSILVPREVRHTPLTYKNGRTRPVVFLCDMTDLFSEWVTDAMRDRVFAAMALRPDVDFLLLTKRPEGALRYVTSFDKAEAIAATAYGLCAPYSPVEWNEQGGGWPWPLPNVGFGVSVENQAVLEERGVELAQIPAAWRWLSCEPLLGALNLLGNEQGLVWPWAEARARGEGIDWVVVGGESGPKRRPCEVEWIADIVSQCDAADVPVFVKQAAGPRPGMQGRIPDVLWARKETWR